ncbi:MAG: OmpA family protein [Candidatus Zixiibacteriota bacterium]|nr:MAG: OmpA family protein [candidate division Zixibacteria bacterium]
MRISGVLLVGILVLLLLGFGCPKQPPVEEPTAPVVTEPETPTTPPEIPTDEVTKREITQKDFEPIYFDFDKYALRPGDREALNRNAQVLKENPAVKIRIEGNCDERGTVEYNLALGEKRARAAMDYLVNLGVGADRVSIITYGKERANHCSGEGCWSKDRRDDFMILSQ